MTRFPTLILTAALFGLFAGCANGMAESTDAGPGGAGGAVVATGGAGGAALGTGGAMSSTGGVAGTGGRVGTGGAGTGGVMGTGGAGTGGAPVTYRACQNVQSVVPCGMVIPGKTLTGIKNGVVCARCDFDTECKETDSAGNTSFCVSACTECDSFR